MLKDGVKFLTVNSSNRLLSSYPNCVPVLQYFIMTETYLVGSFATMNFHPIHISLFSALVAGRLYSRLGFRFGYGSYASYACGRVFPFLFFVFTLIFTLKMLQIIR